MAKVFTITHGLENMGAMKTGGQGSVYKGRRIGEVITAIKLLPTPIYSESENDKNYRDFQNEVQKLKKVNTEPNPNVVKILSSGLSETGNFPFIEMEYIDGPDLEELLLPPHEAVFTIKEVIKVAEQLSNAIAHCHKYEVKHGDIKSNNVKFNLNTGNYVLLDFGLAIMSDEQRRTSLRQAGAVEFMAPEQNEGEMLFQTDVYSFGVVIFELLAGRVPFPLSDKGETARNHVRLAHLETLPPDLMQLRRQSLPANWSQEKKDREMQVPDWLIKMVYTCLKKKPENRFKNGIELHDYIIYNGMKSLATDKAVLPLFNAGSDKEKEQLQQQVSQYRQQIATLQRELDELKSAANNRDSVPAFGNTSTYSASAKNTGVSKTAFVVLLLLTIGLAAFSAYTFINSSNESATQTNETSASKPIDTTGTAAANQAELAAQKAAAKRADDAAKKRRLDSIRLANAKLQNQPPGNQPNPDQVPTTTTASSTEGQGGVTEPTPKQTTGTSVQYMVVSKAYFYNSPDESSRRNAFVVPSNSAILSSQDEQNGFVYVTFTNTQGQTSKGWLRKQDLQQLND
jgi:serine/threonine protein kinase